MKPDAEARGEREPEAVTRAAADWLVRQDRGLTPREAEEFAQWRRADTRHERVFVELEETWRMLPRACERPAARGETVGGSRATRKMFWLPASLAAAAALALAVWWKSAEGLDARFTEMATTEAGTLRRMELPDGSVLQLNAESAVEVVFTPAERHARLVRGQLHLTVAKNPARPFTVSAGAVNVQAVGTAFDVQLAADATVEVLVTEGKVRVDDAARKQSLLALPADAGHAPLLVAGQRARIAPARGTVAVSAPVSAVTVPAEEIAAAQAWYRRQLQFVRVPLAEIVAEFNRYNRHQLVIAEAKLGEQQFGGTFLAGDYETFVRLLESSFDVRAERRSGETVLRAAR